MRPERQRGFTLIELLVSATLGLVLLAGVGTLFLSINRSYRENDLISGMQDQARFGMSTIARDMAMAGYWGGMLGTGNLRPNLSDEDTTNDITSATDALPPAMDCGPAGEPWSFQFEAPVEFRNQDSGDAVGATWNCVNQQRAGTDAVAIRHVGGQPTGTMVLGDDKIGLRPHHFYLQTNATVGTIVRWKVGQTGPDALDQPSLAPMSFHRYYPRIYFVRDFSLTPGDGIPTLCRKELCPTRLSANSDPELSSCGESSGTAGAHGYFTECIAEGVEDLQIVWGLDSPDDNDTIVDRYSASPSTIELRTQARSAQIHLLVRSRRGNPQYVDEKTYSLGDKEIFKPGKVVDAASTPADQQTRHFYRRVYSTTVQLRNLGIQGDNGEE